MSQTAFERLDTVLGQPDDELKEGLPDVLPAAEEDLEELLTSRPEVFARLNTRMGTLDDLAGYAEQERDTVESFLTITWGGMELITENVEGVSDGIDQEYSVEWVSTDSEIAFHMETDPDSGRITGGPGRFEDAELTFEGPTDVMFSMIGDDDFDGTRAFLQGEFQIEGPIPKAQTLEQTMDGVRANAENLTETTD